LIGKYEKAAQGITCRFNREYSLHSGESKREKSGKPHIGKIKKRSPIEFKLDKLDCEYFDFSFIPSDNATYVLRKSKGQQSDDFFSTFNSIEGFTRY